MQRGTCKRNNNRLDKKLRWYYWRGRGNGDDATQAMGMGCCCNIVKYAILGWHHPSLLRPMP